MNLENIEEEKLNGLKNISQESFGEFDIIKTMEMIVNADRVFKSKGTSPMPINLYDVYSGIGKDSGFESKLDKSKYIYNTIMKRNKSLHKEIVDNIRSYLVMDDAFFLTQEKHYTGLYMTMHPVLMNNTIEKTRAMYNPVYDVSSVSDMIQDISVVEDNKDKTIYIAGSFDNITVKDSKTGKNFAILNLSDESGDVEAVMFDDLYSKIKDDLDVGSVGSIGLNMSMYNGRVSVKILEVELHSPDGSKKYTTKDYIKPQHRIKDAI